MVVAALVAAAQPSRAQVQNIPGTKLFSRYDKSNGTTGIGTIPLETIKVMDADQAKIMGFVDVQGHDTHDTKAFIGFVLSIAIVSTFPMNEQEELRIVIDDSPNIIGPLQTDEHTSSRSHEHVYEIYMNDKKVLASIASAHSVDMQIGVVKFTLSRTALKTIKELYSTIS